ncbi:MAG: citrate synthase [Hydrogenibacillus schlegelii]|uniref:Citrate synthase n=1 Tax=Hydrogenibacillus schlegelii TaxID=1484 RepID=A0A947GB52_HYDSH|nr:citrate synthase [Hydrogenibacillus schlegelii]
MTTVAKGLEGVVAAESAISAIENGMLFYRGIDIDTLAERSTFEEVVYLLWHGRLPKRSELDALRSALLEEARVPDDVLELLRRAPKDAHPMSVLRTAVSALALYDPEADVMTEAANIRKAVRLVAKTPTLIAAWHRLRQGKEPILETESAFTAERFLAMLHGQKPDPEAVEALDKALVLHADHEFNASTFAARVTVGTLADLYSGVVSALGALKGPLHGGANEQVMKMLEEIGTPERVEAVIREKLERKERIMGFGHRVYKQGDPRAKHLKRMSERLTAKIGESHWFQMSEAIEALVGALKGLKPNVDFYSATVYHSLGIPRDLFTPIFAMSRMAGWTAHILEQYADNRLIRPRAEYVGPKNVSYVPIEARG